MILQTPDWHYLLTGDEMLATVVAYLIGIRVLCGLIANRKNGVCQLKYILSDFTTMFMCIFHRQNIVMLLNSFSCVPLS
jgi:hypothetical protein